VDRPARHDPPPLPKRPEAQRRLIDRQRLDERHARALEPRPPAAVRLEAQACAAEAGDVEGREAEILVGQKIVDLGGERRAGRSGMASTRAR